MTSSTTSDTPLTDTLPADVSPAVDVPVPTPEKAAIPAFRFPFSPATYAPNKNAGQAWHQKGSSASHEKKIGPAPSGTRRSMGKR